RKYSYDSHYWLTGISNDLFTEKMTYSAGGYNSNEGFYNGLIASDTSIYYGGGPSTHTYRFEYDDFNRLKIADNNLDTMDVGVGTSSSVTYDLNSNITRIKRGTAAVKTYSYYSNK